MNALRQWLQRIRPAPNALPAEPNRPPAQRVSVVTVCLNARDTIRLTLDSVRRQRDVAVDHVIIDGGSTDDTCDIAAEYQPAYFVSEKDNGVYDAMDKGAAAATGDIIIFLNAGDTFFDEDCCADVVDFFNLTGADIVFGNLMPAYLDAADQHDHPSFVPGKLLDLGYVVNRRQLYDESIHHQATFYRRTVFEASRFRCEDPAATGEYHLLLDATVRNGAVVKHIPRPIARFLLGGISTRNFSKEWARYVKARDLLRTRYFPHGQHTATADKYEFRYADVSTAAPPADPLRRKHELKQRIKASFVFRIYERLVRSQSGRIANQLAELLDRHRIDTAAEISGVAGRAIASSTEAATQAVARAAAELAEQSATRAAAQAAAAASHADSLDSLAQSLASLHGAVVRVEQQLSVRLERLEALAPRLAIEQQQAAAASAAEFRVRLADLSGQLLQVHRAVQPRMSFADSGFRASSQWDEDGLIQYLIRHLRIDTPTFIEFGTGDYTESNTRFLLTHDNWRGLIFEGDSANVESFRNSPLYWRYDITAVSEFLTVENINELFTRHGMKGQIGLLSIDVDGVDYWLWQAITVVSPCIVVCEYNGLFGATATVSVPYDPAFDRTRQHYSYLYGGASLAALRHLGRQKGYTMVGINSGGNNAFFVRDDLLRESSVAPAPASFVQPRFRESRDEAGALTYLSFEDAQRLIGEMPVVDVVSDQRLTIREALRQP